MPFSTVTQILKTLNTEKIMLGGEDSMRWEGVAMAARHTPSLRGRGCGNDVYRAGHQEFFEVRGSTTLFYSLHPP